MKKYILCFAICFPLCLILCVAVGLFFLCTVANNNSNGYHINEQERYFSKINEIIKDLDFRSAEAKDGKIILYDKDRNPISEILFEDYDEKQKFIYARKSDDIVYFITGGAVDDEWGIMFVNDGVSDRMMSGVGSANKIGSSSYEYTSMLKYSQ